MKTIRVFVSSPGDVQAERIIADRLIRSIAEELGIPVSVQYSNLLRDAQCRQSPNSSGEQESSELILCPYFWEYQRFSPEIGYQDQMPNTAEFHLVICILWSRLGTKLHPRFRMPDGSEPQSGTDLVGCGYDRGVTPESRVPFSSAPLPSQARCRKQATNRGCG